MKESSGRRTPGPNVAGTWAGFVTLLVGLGTVAYFVVLRGSGFAAELSSARGPELMAVGGAVLLLALCAHLQVASIVRRAAPGSALHGLLRQVDDLDVTDPSALEQFDSIPALRDLVVRLVAEKAQVQELSDRLETLNGEFVGVTEGMRRSAQDLGRVREEHLSPNGVQIVFLWNSLIERVHEAETRAAEAAVSGATGDPGAGEITGLASRLDELETELVRLRSAVATPALQPQGAGTWQREPADQRPRQPVAPFVGASERAPETRMETWSGAQRWSAATPVGGRGDATAPGDVPVEEPGPAVAGWGTPEPWLAPAADDPIASARELLDPDDGFDGSPNSIPAHAAFPEPVVPEPEGMRFPKFVERPNSPSNDRVELTYEAHVADDAVDLPASALLFEPEAEEQQSADKVFDLRAFGATEFDK